MKRLLDDLSTLSTIPCQFLDKLKDKAEEIVAYDVFESVKNLENSASIDIGIGILLIYLENDSIYYKFKPSKSLDTRIRKSLKTGVPTLVEKIENVLSNKITKTYKDLF